MRIEKRKDGRSWAVYDENGQLLTGTLMDYAIPRADFFPNFELARTETPTPVNPLGVKGAGEDIDAGSLFLPRQYVAAARQRGDDR